MFEYRKFCGYFSSDEVVLIMAADVIHSKK